MVIDDELVVEDGVPETPEETEEKVETNASEGVEEVKETTEEVVKPNEDDIEKQIEERANKIAEEKIEARLIRDRIKRERDEAGSKAKYEELETIMKSALGAKDLDDVITKSKEFYKEQGVQIPQIINKPQLTERQLTVLAQDDAQNIIKLGKEEMSEEANRISRIPPEERTLKDKVVFDTVCKELVRINDIDGLKAKGYDTKVLEDKDFSSFREQFNIRTPIAQIYEMYQKINGNKPVQPKSPGSAKTTNTDNEVKDYYTPEEVRQFTEEDLMNNKKLMEAVDRSMLRWGKNK